MKYETGDKKLGMSATGIVGLIFTPLGALFMTLGVLFHYFDIGDEPEDPVIILAVFGSLGLIFFVVGLALLFYEAKRRAGMRRAIDGGEYVMAKIAGVKQLNNQQRAGIAPYVVECHYSDPDTGEAHVYFSRCLRFDPSDLLTAQEVPVYLDRMNDKVYFVDIDAVLPKVVIHNQ
ncbi:MAG: hypothetical protein IKS31_00380 [Clostridia bacterium]|nr:hypothetical protein [Clostridia bacterium]